MATVQSSRNPFRNPPSSSSHNGPSQLSPAPPSSSTEAVANHNLEPSPSVDILSEELPPAYTPAPNSQQGEQTVEYGPTRPFQNPAPAPPIQHPVTPQSTGWSTANYHSSQYPQPQSLWRQVTGTLVDQLSNLSTGSSYNRYGPPRMYNTGYGPSPPSVPAVPSPPAVASNLVPPPLPPRTNLSPPSLPPRSSSTSPMSEFTRDFYTAGPNSPAELSEVTADAQRPTVGYVPPPGSPPSQYAPPSGPPPSQYAPPPGPPPSQHYHPPPAPPPSNSVPDNEARPTKTPVPGHPLLNQGRILVYPAGYECEKCHNVGYKQNDPTHPCRRCWSKYAKPFTGAITYSSFKSSSAGTGKTFQQPLPSFRPPQAGSSQRNSGYPGSAYTQNLGQGQTARDLNSPPVSYPPPNVQMVSGGYSPYGSPQPLPPGAVVYAPGDPRLGGQVCWRCDGEGIVDRFLFEEQCDVCGGVGRTFR